MCVARQTFTQFELNFWVMTVDTTIKNYLLSIAGGWRCYKVGRQIEKTIKKVYLSLGR